MTSEAQRDADGGAPAIGRGRLHGVSLSPFVRKVRAALAIKGIDYELVNVMPGAVPPEFHAISPMSKIPVWEDADGWTLPDSTVICAYLERIVPTPSLYPMIRSDPRAYARDLFWEEYADTRLVEATGPVFFQRFVRKKVMKEASDEEIVRRHVEEMIPPVFDQLEALFIERDGADASVLSVGNLSVWAACVNLAHAGIAREGDRWPGLVDFLEALNAHETLARIVDEERAAVAGF